MAGILGKILNTKKGTRRLYCSAVIAAAGSSVRMGRDKIFEIIGDKPVLAHTLLAFQNSDFIDEIIVVTKSESLARAAEICENYSITKASKVICGGASRLESVFKGVLEVSREAELIAVHDGARPFVSRDIIGEAVTAAEKWAAAAPAIQVRDTIKRATDGIAAETLKRDELYAVQTPQVFDASILKAALQNALDKGIQVTDDCSAVELLKVPIHLTEGSDKNIKITTPMDLEFADYLIKKAGE